MIEFEIGGKVRKFNFGLQCMGNSFERLDTDLANIGKVMLTNPFKATPAIFYEAHRAAVEYDGKLVDFSYSEVCKWLDDIDGGINNKNIEKGFELFLETLKNHLPKTEDVEGDGAKKK